LLTVCVTVIPLYNSTNRNTVRVTKREQRISLSTREITLPAKNEKRGGFFAQNINPASRVQLKGHQLIGDFLRLG